MTSNRTIESRMGAAFAEQVVSVPDEPPTSWAAAKERFGSLHTLSEPEITEPSRRNRVGRFTTALVVAGGLAAGGAGLAAATNSTDNTSNTAPYPPGVAAPTGKTPLPSARVTPPATNVLPNPADSGLSNSVPACGAAPSAPPCNPQGISSLHQAPFSQQDFQVSNEYGGTLNGSPVMVYAGAAMSPAQGSGNPTVAGGGVRVLVGSNPIQQYLAPSGSGPLTITNVSGSVLTLTDPSGDTLTFNLATDTYS